VCGTSAAAATSHPLGAQVVSGAASITQAGNTTDIRQSSADVSIDWQSFNIGSQATVDFLQPSASSIAVNRIFSTDGSQVLGHLDANGQVYLINPNGIIFGEGATVNVGGLVASTLNVSESSLAGNAQAFSGNGAGSIVNQGTINAANGGYVALIGNHVSNEGIITAHLGTVALGAGSAVTLDFAGNQLVHLQVDQSTLNNLVQNNRLIEADGGLVIMTAGAKNALLASVVNNTGIIEARTVNNREGAIELLGSMTAGTVNVGGTLDANAPNGGNGGFIETNAARVEVANGAVVTAAASKGLYGTWLIDPTTDFTVAPTGGDITGATLGDELDSASVTILSSNGASPVTGGGSGGNINVNDTVSWDRNTTLTLTAANNVNVNSTITASVFTISHRTLGETAALVINPNTANGSETASGTGTLNLGADASISLNGTGASLSISTSNYTLGAGATINLPNVSAASTTALVIGGTYYTVINSLGAAGSFTGADLQGINGNLYANYALGSNINAAATATWNSNGATPPVYAGFTPLGNSSVLFLGTFDGLGHTISNLFINLPTADNVGLFGDTATATVIRNVGLVGGSVNGSYGVGGLVGLNHGAVSNSYVMSSVTGSTYLVGGLVGWNYGPISSSHATGTVSGAGTVGGLVGADFGAISNSYATGTVSGAGTVGGLVGVLEVGAAISNSFATGGVGATLGTVGGLVGVAVYGTISSSHATGSVSGAGYAGGLVGYIVHSTISNSYATGSVNGSTYVGGLVGYNYGGTISNSYATGKVSGTSQIGGLVGYNYGDIISSYATGNVTGTSLVGGLVGVNVLGSVSNSYAMGTVSGASYVGGLVGANGGYGTISGSHATGSVSGTTQVGGLAGSNYGGISGSYATGPVSGTKQVGGLVGANLLVTAIGTYGTVSGSYATGNVSGASGSSDIGGLVGLNFGKISSSYATGSSNGSGYLGGLVGYNDGGTIYYSYATGLVGGDGFYVGGLVGYNSGTVSNSYASGSVGSGGSSDVGGLVGVNFGTISNSYATGAATNGYYGVGGLVGQNYGTISNTYATGEAISTGGETGGLVGYNSGTVSNSYATGTARGTGSYIGGLVGVNSTSVSSSYSTGSVSGAGGLGGLVGYNSGTVSTSFWDVTSSGRATSAGGIGMTTAQMQTQANFTSATSANGNVNPGWDFTNTWVMYDGYTYPLLRSFMTPLTVTANNATTTYSGSGYSGGNGVTYSSTPNANLLGTVSYGGTSQGAVNVGGYVITPGGLYSNQQGYLISYASGTLSIDQLASVAWIGGASGDWSNAANWAGGAIPDLLNVANVTIPKKTTVTYDAGVAGTTILTTLTDGGKLVMAAGDLSTTGNLTTAGYIQTGGLLDVGGTLTINAKLGTVKLGDIDAAVLSVTAEQGIITQRDGTAVDVTGATSLTADNGTGGLDTITLAQAGDSFGGTVTAEGSAIKLRDNKALDAIIDSSGATSLTVAGALQISGTVGTTLTTKTTGKNHATTFGATTVGTSLNVTSTGAVTENAANTLIVAGLDTTTAPNPDVTVNGVNDVEIPVTP
jgi:filamentous hemagglutinin family protein